MFRSCSHADLDTAEVLGFSSGGIGFIKGKSAIAIARNYGGKRKNFVGQHFWARGYYVSTVGREEATVRQYIQRQEAEDQRIEQLRLSDDW